MFSFCSFSLCYDSFKEVVISSGTYYLNESFKVESNTKYKMENVNFVGGVRLNYFQHISDMKVKEYFDVDVRDKIYECDLKKNGFDHIFSFEPRGFGYTPKWSHNHLYIDGTQMNIAQYPKLSSFIKFVGPENPSKINTVGCIYNDSRPNKWHTTKGIYTWGYWKWGWSGSTQEITKFDRENMKLVFGNAKDSTECKKDDRFFFFNIIEEVRYPGDFYIDNETLMLYFYPFEGFNPSLSNVVLSNSSFNMVYGYNVHNVSIEGLTISEAKETAVLITGSNILLNGVTVKNIGRAGIRLGGTNNVVMSSTIHNTLDNAVEINGGNRATLEKGNCMVTNCTIYWFGNMTRTYTAGIIIRGVGDTVSHCHVHNGPQIGIGWNGNDHLFEFNEVDHVISEATDAGVTYSGRDYTSRGNVFRYNYLHDVTESFAMGIYNDDCLSGTAMYNNVFVNLSRAVMLGGGRDFLVKNNIFVGNHPAISIDGRCNSDTPMWRNMVNVHLRDTFYGIAKNVTGVTEPYISRYPELLYIHKKYVEAGQNIPYIPPSASLINNIFMDNTKDMYIDKWAKKGNEIFISGYFNATASDFVDYENGDFSISEKSSFVKDGFVPFDMNKIGLIHSNSGGSLPGGLIFAIIFALILLFTFIGCFVYYKFIRERKETVLNETIIA